MPRIAVILLVPIILLVAGTATSASSAAPAGPTTAKVETETEALAATARRAADRIRAHQAAAGSWPTAVTQGLAFQQPGAEVNVFVPALMVELLEPAAKEMGLTDVVERARAWLSVQIEETGLVRYHGNPGPVANPGCELPPDSDDTALVWRLAPRSETALRDAARATIDKYRTDGGLYRVWLAPEDVYKCFYKYSGRELNPSDVAIQMHLYLFFARYDPEAARRLCDALGPRMADEQIWVYYQAAPFIPRLREADLALAGCPLRIPEARLRNLPKDQEPYLDLAELHRRLLLNESPEPDRAAVRRLLTRLAADDFAAVERTPPLLYHNDLTATPPHFHWSANVGYALWLRAYMDLRQGAGGR